MRFWSTLHLFAVAATSCKMRGKLFKCRDSRRGYSQLMHSLVFESQKLIVPPVHTLLEVHGEPAGKPFWHVFCEHTRPLAHAM
jgi:hypothetical protein